MSLTIEVELLAGTYAATQFDDRNAVEWPPHPARLFSAMVAAWADADESADEAEAMRWLEAVGDPTIRCSFNPEGDENEAHDQEVAIRHVVTHFVPVNDPSVVARDPRSNYERIIDSQAKVAAAGDESAERTRAERGLAKAIKKAQDDSAAAASKGEAPEKAIEILPYLRGRQARTYPVARPVDPKFEFTWEHAAPDDATKATLDGLLSRVGRLGHSSSLVSCRVANEAGRPTLVPVATGDLVVRVPGAGQLDRLCELYSKHQGQGPRAMPARGVRYDRPRATAPAAPRSTFTGGFIVAALHGPPLAIGAALPVARTVRKALLHVAGRHHDVIPEVISGHEADPDGGRTNTRPTKRNHLAIVPLPFVGHEHADGTLMGVAFALPDDLIDDEREAIHQTVGDFLQVDRDPGDRTQNLWGRALGSTGRWSVVPIDLAKPPSTLTLRRWTHPSRRWASVTPIFLDRYPHGFGRGSLAKRARAEAEVRASIVRSCEGIGLPIPTSVEVRTGAPVRGSRAVSDLPPFTSGKTSARRFGVHATIGFDEPVSGPVLLGRGRFLGQGLCLPLRDFEGGDHG